ncbi:MAG: hypothetical protein VKP57_07570 [Candidatus Sericytochromatia bacterium]|nr:hypothetical protein [Candidatus Sericytochromatia bacterium]
MAPRRIKVAALSAVLAQGFMVTQATAAPDLWPDYRLAGQERVSEFKAGREIVDRLGDGSEVAGTRKTVRRNERVEPLREKDPTQNLESFEEVPASPVFSTKVVGRIHSTMSATKFDKFRYAWTETPYKDYTVKKWEQRDEFWKDVPYQRRILAEWNDPASGRAMRFEGANSRYTAQESAVTAWQGAADPKVYVGAGVDKSARTGPFFVSSRTEVKEVARKSLASVQAASSGAGSASGLGATRVFQGDSAKGISQAQKAAAGQIAATLGSRTVKASQGANPVSVKAIASIQAAKSKLEALPVRSAVAVQIKSALELLARPDATDAQIKAALNKAKKNAWSKNNAKAIEAATQRILKARKSARNGG